MDAEQIIVIGVTALSLFVSGGIITLELLSRHWDKEEKKRKTKRDETRTKK